MTGLGTLQWARRTGGTITPADRDELNSRLGAVLEAAARPVPVPPLDIVVDDRAVPDSALCRDATDLWRNVAADWLHGHGHRTWHYARALAEVDQLDTDPELLYVACLLHDLGLTTHAPPTDTTPCFAVTGAHAAASVVAPHRAQTDTDLVEEAIAMHLNIDIPTTAGALHYLVASATLIDVTGPRLQLLPEQLIDAILQLHPRGDFGPRVGNALARIGATFPDTRCGYLHHTLDIATLTNQHPLDHPNQ